MDMQTLQTLRRDAEDICRSAIEASVPDAAIQRALAQLPPCQGRTVLVSIGKAGWQTAKAAYDALETDTEKEEFYKTLTKTEEKRADLKAHILGKFSKDDEKTVNGEKTTK